MASTMTMATMRELEHTGFLPRPNTETHKQSFTFKGVILWNSLSPETKQAVLPLNVFSTLC